MDKFNRAKKNTVLFAIIGFFAFIGYVIVYDKTAILDRSYLIAALARFALCLPFSLVLINIGNMIKYHSEEQSRYFFVMNLKFIGWALLIGSAVIVIFNLITMML